MPQEELEKNIHELRTKLLNLRFQLEREDVPEKKATLIKEEKEILAKYKKSLFLSAERNLEKQKGRGK